MAKSIAAGSRNSAGQNQTSLLTAAWLLVFAATAATAAWLFANAEDTKAKRQTVRVVIPISTIVSSVPPVAEAPAPEPVVVVAPPSAPTPAPTATGSPAPNLPSKIVPVVKLSAADTPPPPKAAPAREPVSVKPLEPPAPAPVKLASAEPLHTASAPAVAAPVHEVAAVETAPMGSGDALPLAPDPAMINQSQYGPLPVISPDGRQAWQVYARPFSAPDDKPRVTLIVGGLGLAKNVTDLAIAKLPAGVTLGFDPYAQGLEAWMGKARAAGHETLLSVPMEPVDFPNSDPGPATLLTSLQPADNVQRLEWTLARGSGYVGVIAMAGGRFLSSAKDLLPIFEQLRRRGLMFVDNQATTETRAARLARDTGLPRAMTDRRIDDEPTPAKIDARLAELEKIAKSKGAAVGLAEDPTPVVIDRVAAWAAKLKDQKILLAPASANANRQADMPLITAEQIKAEEEAKSKQ